MVRTEDDSIIERILQGDSDSFSFLVKKYQDIVFSITLKLLKNREDAEELAQETFIRAFQSIGSFQGKSKFSTWLFRITYNNCISHLRKKKFHFSGIDNLSESDMESDEDITDLPGEIRIRYLATALKQLPAEDYLLVLLYYYEDQSVEEICVVTGFSESNVKVKLFRARKKLRSMMNELILKNEFVEL